MTWSITSEHHVSPPARYAGRDVPSIEFFYAIRRRDGSLLFRAETLGFAEEIVGRVARSAGDCEEHTDDETLMPLPVSEPHGWSS